LIQFYRNNTGEIFTMTMQNLSPTHEATIDWSVLETLQTFRKQGAPDPRTRLINIFLSSSPPLLDSLQTAIQAADPDSLANAAHSMKSGSLNMGATELGELCARLEKIGRLGSIEEAEDLLARLELEYAAVEAAFRKIVSEHEN
jgi:HPt (histidine-containing phosphotransfer) domain-containing protein